VPTIHDTLGITGFAILFGLDCIATVPPTIALAADGFGKRNVGVIYGWVFAAHMFGAAIAAFAAGAGTSSVTTRSAAASRAGWRWPPGSSRCPSDAGRRRRR